MTDTSRMPDPGKFGDFVDALDPAQQDALRRALGMSPASVVDPVADLRSNFTREELMLQLLVVQGSVPKTAANPALKGVPEDDLAAAVGKPPARPRGSAKPKTGTKRSKSSAIARRALLVNVSLWVVSVFFGFLTVLNTIGLTDTLNRLHGVSHYWLTFCLFVFAWLVATLIFRVIVGLLAKLVTHGTRYYNSL